MDHATFTEVDLNNENTLLCAMIDFAMDAHRGERPWSDYEELRARYVAEFGERRGITG